MGTLTASGDWGLVSEPPQSNDKGALNSTPNILLNTNLFSAFNFSPQSIAMGGDGGYGPFTVSVSLSQVSLACSTSRRLLVHTAGPAAQLWGRCPLRPQQCSPSPPSHPWPEHWVERAIHGSGTPVLRHLRGPALSTL